MLNAEERLKIGECDGPLATYELRLGRDMLPTSIRDDAIIEFPLERCNSRTPPTELEE